MLKKALLLLPCLFTIVLAGWTPEEQVTNNNTYNYLGLVNSHKVVVAANGVRHLVWYRGGVYYKRYYPGSGWTSDYQLTTIKNSNYPSIALDSNGMDIHVVWEGDGGPRRNPGKHIYYQKCVPTTSGNGGWVGTPKDITPDAGSSQFRFPDIACYQGHVVVTWFEWRSADTVGFCECVDGNWGNPVYFADPSGTGGTAWYPCISVDPQARYGDVFISALVISGDGSRTYVYVIRRQGGIWQAWEDATGGGPFEHRMEVNPSTGYPHIVCDPMSYLNIYHTYWDPTLGWRPLELISDPSAVSCRRPSMFFSGSTAFVVWAESSSVYGIRYSIGQYGNWTTPDWVASGYRDDYPHVTARSNGDVYVVWEDGRKSKTQIWGRLYTPGSFSGLGANPALLTREFLLDASPNPCSRGTKVRYSVPVAADVLLRLYDVRGVLKKTLACGHVKPGNNSVSLSTQDLTRGVYILRLETGTCDLIRKFVIE